MDIRDILRKETKTQHIKVENSPLLKKITNKTITLTEYQHLLEIMYGFIYRSETAIQNSKHSRLIDGRRKTDLLRNDLKDLNHLLCMKQLNEMVEKNNNTPILSSKLDILGYLYVIEGSTLGGQVITKILGDHLKLSHLNGLRYFHGYGSDTRNKWDNFCLQLKLISCEQEMNAVINSAKNTFNTLNVCLLEN